MEKVHTLLDKMGQDGLSDEQQQILDELRCCLMQQTATSPENIVKERAQDLQQPIPSP